jgi:WD40 repeat protein
MQPKVGRMLGLLWLGVACLGLVPPLSAQQPKPRATLKGHKQQVFSVSYSPDGKTLASGSEDKTIKLWDAKTGKERATLKGLMSDDCSSPATTIKSPHLELADDN